VRRPAVNQYERFLRAWFEEKLLTIDLDFVLRKTSLKESQRLIGNPSRGSI